MSNTIDIHLIDGPWHAQTVGVPIPSAFSTIDVAGDIYHLQVYTISAKKYRVGVFNPENISVDVPTYIVANEIVPAWDLNRSDAVPVPPPVSHEES